VSDDPIADPSGEAAPRAAARSDAPCPSCGAHRLAVIEFPELTGSQPSATGETPIGGRGPDLSPPAIGCLACGAEWPDLDSFRAAVERRMSSA
jgi:hypothetical protein